MLLLILQIKFPNSQIRLRRKTKVSGTINFSATIKDEKDYTLSGKMTINGKADSNNAEINTAIELNEKELKELADKFTAELEGEAKNRN